MRDKYDDAIAFLTKNPLHIKDSWFDGGMTSSHPEMCGPGACLFQWIDRSRPLSCDLCLTMARNADDVTLRNYPAHASIIREIMADTRLPPSPDSITTASLPVFAEWNRRLDTLFGAANAS